MALRQPHDPYLADALGAAKFARETIKLGRKKRLNLDAAVYWAARYAAHWAQKSNEYTVLSHRRETSAED